MWRLIVIALLFAGVCWGQPNGFDFSNTGTVHASGVTSSNFAFWASGSHYATMDGTEYVDGVAQAWNNDFYELDGTDLIIGHNGTAQFLGTSHDFRIYSRALSAEEIAHLASMGCSTNGINTAYDPDFGDVYLVTDGSALYAGDDRAGGVPRDMVAEYLFTSDATDTSGNGNNGSVEGGATVDGVLNLDGIDDFINTSNSFESVFQSAFSVSYWVQFDDGQPLSSQMPYGTQTGPTNRVISFLDTAGGFTVGYISDGNQGRAEIDANFSNGVLPWMHIAEVVTPSGITVYKDGVEQTLDATDNGDMSGVTMANYSNPYHLYIGARNINETIDAKMAGAIDNWRLYDRALTATEITRLYKEGIPTHSGSLVLNAHAFTPIGESATATDLTGHQTLSVSGTVDAVSSELRFVGSLAEGWKLTPYRPDGTDWMPQSDGLVAMYRMGKNGTFDDVVSTNNGTAYGDAVATLGTGGEFDGTGDYVSIPHNENHWAGTSFSQSCWFKSTSANIQIMLEKYNNSATSGEDLSASFRGYGFRLNAGKTQIYMGDTLTEVSAISTATYNDGSWHLAVWTYDGAGLNLYTDGFLVDSTYTTLTPTPTTENLRIGGDYPEQTNRYFTGTIDETAIWSTALTAQDVARLYSTQKGKYP